MLISGFLYVSSVDFLGDMEYRFMPAMGSNMSFSLSANGAQRPCFPVIRS